MNRWEYFWFGVAVSATLLFAAGWVLSKGEDQGKLDATHSIAMSVLGSPICLKTPSEGVLVCIKKDEEASKAAFDRAANQKADK